MMMSKRFPTKSARQGCVPHQRGENNGRNKNYQQNNERHQATTTSTCYVAIFVFPHCREHLSSNRCPAICLKLPDSAAARLNPESPRGCPMACALTSLLTFC